MTNDVTRGLSSCRLGLFHALAIYKMYPYIYDR